MAFWSRAKTALAQNVMVLAVAVNLREALRDVA